MAENEQNSDIENAVNVNNNVNIDIDTIRMSHIASMKSSMIFIIIIDFIGNLFFSAFASYINIIPILLDIVGYHGTRTYKPMYLSGYFCYTIILLIGRIYYLINPPSTTVFIFAILFVVYYAWSLEFTWKYMTTLFKIPIEKRSLMREPGWDIDTTQVNL